MIECAIPQNASLRDAVQALESARRTIAVVVDAGNQVLGTISDGDVRRVLLEGRTLDSPALDAANRSPVLGDISDAPGHLLALMRARNIEAIPCVDQNRKLVSVTYIRELANQPHDHIGVSPFSCAVIMAGGEGQRLRPITQAIPKPMVEIGGQPLLRLQIERLRRAGIRRIYIAINYLGHVIEDYFGDGNDFGVSISYLREETKLGTGGALSLLPNDISGTILVMNGDVVTQSNFGALGMFHQHHGALLTVSAVEHHVQIPYGVVVSDGPKVQRIDEKPSQFFRCNAGIYALSDQCLRHIAPASFMNMTDLIDVLLQASQPVAVFPIYEFWSDIGTPEELAATRTRIKEIESHD
jgi:dTDP-glucose pyrophosphorylase